MTDEARNAYVASASALDRADIGASRPGSSAAAGHLLVEYAAMPNIPRRVVKAPGP
jgi:hypothetical protein